MQFYNFRIFEIFCVYFFLNLESILLLYNLLLNIHSLKYPLYYVCTCNIHLTVLNICSYDLKKSVIHLRSNI